MSADPWYRTVNQTAWDRDSDAYQAKHREQLEASGGSAWGVWQIPEAELDVLGEVAGLDVLEFGCGAAQWSIALARQGARVTGLDLSERQLAHARELVAAAGVDVTLVHSGAEQTPFADASFDIVFCDHGAMTFADPHLAVPEAARLLRPGGLFAFSMNTPWLDVCWPVDLPWPTRELATAYYGMHHAEDEDGTVTFNLTYGEWIALFGRWGLVVESLVELRPDPDAVSSYRPEAAREWARRWPMEHIWRLRRIG